VVAFAMEMVASKADAAMTLITQCFISTPIQIRHEFVAA